MGSFASLRSGLAVRVASDPGGSDDFNQVVDSLLAVKRLVNRLLLPEGCHEGGAWVVGDLSGGGINYPASTFVIVDDSGEAWFLRNASAQAIVFSAATIAAATLYAYPAQMASVSPAAATGLVTGIVYRAQATADAAPAHSLVLGTGVVGSSAFSSFTVDANLAAVGGNRFCFPKAASDPANPVEGQAYVKTSDHKLYVYLNGSWVGQT